MKILCISHFDNGGQMQNLSYALNNYTNHNCKHINTHPTYLNFDVDIDFNKYSTDEIKSIINESNFFIFSEFIPQKLLDIGIMTKLNRNNMIIRCYGSYCRTNVNYLRKWWTNTFGTFTSGGLDPSIHPYLGFTVYHIPHLYNFNKFPVLNQSDPIKICHASTKIGLKSTVNINDTLNKLKKKYNIIPVIITNKSWKESLKLKAQCHITVDQFKLSAYGGSAIESMYLNHAVVSNISPLVRSFHPDLPIIQATEDNIYYVLEDLILDQNKIKRISKKGNEFAIKEHSDKLNIIKWEYLIKWVTSNFI